MPRQPRRKRIHWWELPLPPKTYGEKHEPGHHHRCVVCGYRTGQCNRRIWHKLWCPRCGRPDDSVPSVPLVLVD